MSGSGQMFTTVSCFMCGQEFTHHNTDAPLFCAGCNQLSARAISGTIRRKIDQLLSAATLRADKAEADATAMRETLSEVVEAIDLLPTDPKTFARKAGVTMAMLRGGCALALVPDAGSHLLAELKAARRMRLSLPAHTCVQTGEIENEGDDRSCGICNAAEVYDRARAKRSG